MRASALAAFAATDYLNEGHAPVIERARPYFAALVDELAALPDDAGEELRLDALRRCIEGLNGIGDDIETVERECFCAALYAIGEIVGIPESSEFVEEWRGDW
jgi:hypothetical protein